MRILTLLALLTGLCGCHTDGVNSQSTAPAAPPERGPLPPAEAPDFTVTLRGAPAGEVLLIGHYMDQQFRAAEATADASGTVRFQREEPFEPGYYFAYYSDGSAAQFLLSEDQTFTLTADKDDVPGTARITGQQDSELLYDGLRYEATLQPRFAAAGEDRSQRTALARERSDHYTRVFADHPDRFYTAYKRAGQNPEIRTDLSEQDQVTAYRYDFWEGVDFSDPRLLRTPVIANKLKRYIGTLTPQNADSIKRAADFLLARVLDHPEYYQFIANNITLSYEPGKTQVMDGEAIHAHMIQNYFTRERAFWADSMTVYGLQQRADEMAHSLVGQPGPDITVPGLDGKPQRLYDLEQPYLIVYMYNPTCEHCIEETPRLVEYARGEPRVGVYAIALDTERDEWSQFVRQYGLGDFTNVMDPTNRSIYKTYFVDNTPELYLLDRDRTIIAKNLKPAQVARAIEIAEGG